MELKNLQQAMSCVQFCSLLAAALGIGAASFASGVKRSEQRYSGKPDGGAVSGDGTPKGRLQDYKSKG